MPFKSKAQQRFMFAAQAEGSIPEGMANRWAKETKNFKKLPEKVKPKTAGLMVHNALMKCAAIKEQEMPKGTPLFDSLDTFRKKLKPGDIIMSKKYVTAGRKWVPAIVAKVTGSPWTHAGIYIGDGTVAHIATPPYKKVLKSKYREGKLRSFNAPGEGLLALRPKVSAKERRRAVKEIRQLGKGTTYSNLDLIRAGFFPRKLKDKVVDTAVKSSYICTGLIASAYDKIPFRPGVGGEHTRPGDLIKSPETKAIAGYQPEEKVAAAIAAAMNAYTPDKNSTGKLETRNFRTAPITEHGLTSEEEMPSPPPLPKPEDDTKYHIDKVGHALARALRDIAAA